MGTASEDTKVRPAVVLRNLCVIGHGFGFTQWHYSAESLREVLETGFFDDAAGMITQGDHVSISAPDGGAVLYMSAGCFPEVMCRTGS